MLHLLITSISTRNGKEGKISVATCIFLVQTKQFDNLGVTFRYLGYWFHSNAIQKRYRFRIAGKDYVVFLVEDKPILAYPNKVAQNQTCIAPFRTCCIVPRRMPLIVPSSRVPTIRPSTLIVPRTQFHRFQSMGWTSHVWHYVQVRRFSTENLLYSLYVLSLNHRITISIIFEVSVLFLLLLL